MVTGVESEDDAVDTFQRGVVDLVILDYRLAQGDGLNCLHQLRRLDAIVPVIAVSGTVTLAVAAQLIEAGADDCLSKESIDKIILAESMVSALIRAKGIRARVPQVPGKAMSRNRSVLTAKPIGCSASFACRI